MARYASPPLAVDKTGLIRRIPPPPATHSVRRRKAKPTAPIGPVENSSPPHGKNAPSPKHRYADGPFERWKRFAARYPKETKASRRIAAETGCNTCPDATHQPETVSEAHAPGDARAQAKPTAQAGRVDTKRRTPPDMATLRPGGGGPEFKNGKFSPPPTYMMPSPEPAHLRKPHSGPRDRSTGRIALQSNSTA